MNSVRPMNFFRTTDTTDTTDTTIWKPGFTKKRNEIELLINKFESSAAVELKLSELKSAFEQLKLSHGNYHETLTEEEEIQDSLDYLSNEELKAEDLISRLQKCKDSAEKNNLEGPFSSKSRHSELASSTTKSRKSASSVSSSVSNARATIASFRFEDDDENEDQVQLLLIVRMLKSVTVMA